MKRFALPLLIAAGLASAAGPAPASAEVTTFEGQWQCDDRGTVGSLPGAELQLWGRGWDWFPVEVTGGIADRGHTADDGSFSLRSAESEDTYFVRTALRDDLGTRLKDFAGINDWSVDSEGIRNRGGTSRFGGLLLSTPGQSHKCAVWRGFHFANADYQAIMDARPPSGDVLVKADAITGGTPFAMHTEVSWPSGYPVSDAAGGDVTPRHEFAHTVRHAFDGDYGHFLGDVVAHEYARHHNHCSRTSPAFAFNEGWAEYWARDFTAAPHCPSDVAVGDFSVEGNVAAELTIIERDCFLGSRRKMVEVLQRSPLAIHSLDDFRARAVCDVVLAPVFEPMRLAEPKPIELSPEDRAAIGRAGLRTIDTAIRGYEAALRRAKLAAAKRTPSCTKPPCDDAFRKATEPDAIAMKLKLAKLTRVQRKQAASVEAQRNADQVAIKIRAQRDERDAKRQRKLAAKIIERSLDDTLAHSAKLFEQDKSERTKLIRKRLLAARAAARKAAKDETTPLPFDPATVIAPEQPKKVAIKPFPSPVPPSSQTLLPAPAPQAPAPTAPEPTPPAPTTPAEPVSSTLSLTCPASGKAGTYAITGGLTPALDGATVTLEVTQPQGPPASQNATTANGGLFSSGVALAYAGTWSIKATFAGDASTKPSSTTCQVTIS